ncbi:hypothetical protein R5W24_001570 [Gemmata sp. JC717]|uniref:MJ0042-type zinc finger domain-containing protein n=1 Tax=Gemmata algarum TaxID=2975278 RepID=UPI0021BAFE60|nr:MJ0042-type zinc finger domain-containing protein [Gemmata algarum]MDY3552488.1 hypothetical protein [Gemmata algarum]
MPIRLVCPSCSAALSVKDEYAGRAVKCPKCGGVIPGSASAPPASKPALPSPLPPLPQEPKAAQNPFEVVNETEEPKGERASDKDRTRDDERGESRPRRDRGDDRNDEAIAKRSKRNSHDDDDRPVRKKRRRDDDYDDGDQPVKEKGSKVVLIIAIVCVTLLLGCGGAGLGLYFAVIKPIREGVENTVEKAREELKTWNPLVSVISYSELEVGESTRATADAKLGTGRIATEEDLSKVFADAPGRAGEWAAKVSAKRAVVWQNGEDYIIVAFHPMADGLGRLQMKEWRPKSGASVKEGELDDVKFLQQYPQPKGRTVTADVPELSIEDFSREARANPDLVTAKYLGATIIIRGKLNKCEEINKQIMLRMYGAAVCMVRPGAENGALAAPNGQLVCVKGRCMETRYGVLGMFDCQVIKIDTPNYIAVSADDLLNSYKNNKFETRKKYTTEGGKFVYLHITDALVAAASRDESQLILTGPTAENSKLRLRVHYCVDTFETFGLLSPGDRVDIKGLVVASKAPGADEFIIEQATMKP